jgi:hypothetical protein
MRRIMALVSLDCAYAHYSSQSYEASTLRKDIPITNNDTDRPTDTLISSPLQRYTLVHEWRFIY